MAHTIRKARPTPMLEPCDITVVIPTYNRKGLIARAVKSVLDQTLQPAQVIVVDDGSTDGTEEVCKAYTPKVQYVWQRNAGVSAARNTGIRLATLPLGCIPRFIVSGQSKPAISGRN